MLQRTVAKELRETATVKVFADISHDSDPERPKQVASRKQRIFDQNDQNCAVCKRTKITRALCRRRTGSSVPRAEKFGDLITTDHKVLRYSIAVQDLATEHFYKPKVIYTDKSFQPREGSSWNHCTSTPHRSETNGIAERAVRRVKEGTSCSIVAIWSG